ncbi:autotransporter domain-containing protein [Aquabacter sp. CN5-332]|uniref:autotransporter outer membrane beta-barrel domain-containing protein n=1 Tax=Aquabacter sp. CN5-332 TaxID=3156608 RepID=UPI0032B51C48
MQVLIATKGTCIDPKAPNAQSCVNTDSPTTAMMGVGFDRNTMGVGAPNAPHGTSLPGWLEKAAPTPASLNPFLNVVGMGDIMRRGYIVTPTGVKLGLTTANTASSGGNPFAYGQLAPLGPGQPHNWQAQPLVVTVTNPAGATTGPQGGVALMDTGVQDGLLTLPNLNSDGFTTDTGILADGVTVTLDLLGAQGLVGYNFKVGTGNPQIPAGVHWSSKGSGTFFNTSLFTYTGINILYDADGGFVGVQLNGASPGTGYLPGTDAYVTPVLVANGLLQPVSDLSVDLPVLLTGAATVSTVNANATFSGDMTGPGSLAITGPGTVTLAGNGTFTGGTFVQQGTLSLTGTLTGSLDISAGAAFTSAGGYAVAQGATLTNAGTFTTTTVDIPMMNAGTLVNSGVITSPLGNMGTLRNSGQIVGEVANVGTFRNSGSIVGPVANSGTLENGGGIVGDVINTGVFRNDGIVIGSLTNRGTLTGSGGAANLVNAPGGSLAPGGAGVIGTFTVLDSFSTQHGSMLSMDLGRGGTSDKVAVGTAATLGGGVLLLTLGAGAGVGSSYTLISAGSVTGAFEAVSTGNPLLTAAVTYGANGVVLSLQRSSVPFASHASTGNQSAVASGADTLDTGHAVSQAIVQLSGLGAAAAFDALSGEAYATTSGVLASQSILVRNAVMDRARQPVIAAPPPAVPLSYAAPVASGPFAVKAAPEDAPVVPSNAFWTEAFGAWGHVDDNGNASSASTSVGGFLVGVDGVVANAWRVGFAAGYSSSTISVTDLSSSTSADTVHVAVYGGGMAGALALRFGAAYAWSDMSSSRTVAFPGLVNQLSADYGARTGQLFGEMAYPVALSAATVEPFAGLAYVNVNTDNFTETGGIAALGTNGGTDAVTYTSLGARGALPFQLGTTVATLKGSLAWQHAFGDVTPEGTFFFTGSQAFTVTGAPLAEDAALVEAGIDVAFTPTMSLSVFYSGQLAENAQENMVKGGFSLKF